MQGYNIHAANMVFILLPFKTYKHKGNLRYLNCTIFQQKISLIDISKPTRLLNASATMPAIASTGIAKHHRVAQIYHRSPCDRDVTKLPLSLYRVSKGPRDALLDAFSTSPTLQTLVYPLVENEIYVREFTAEDWMYSGVRYDSEQEKVITYYKIRPSIARQMWKGVVNMACLTICAANDTTWQEIPRRGPSDPVYPLDVLLEWGSNFLYVIPHLSLSRDTDSDNPLLSYETPSLRQLKQYFIGYQNVVCYYGNWIRSAVKTSLNSGFQSETNWGAFWNFSKEDFLKLATPGVFDLARAREEGRFRRVGHDMGLEPIRSDALILHPQHCNAVEWGNGFGYDPRDPYFDINDCVPKAFQSTDTEEMDAILAFGNRGYRLQE